jgi:hypothetical protein
VKGDRGWKLLAEKQRSHRHRLYIGAIIQKQPSLPQGATLAAGTQACTGWCPQFAFGINLPAKALQAKLKAKPANAGGAGNSQEGAGQSPAKVAKQ